MSQINKIQLKTSCILDVPLQKYPKDFTFIVNGQEFKTSRIISDLLSPNICKIHSNDPTFSTYIINTKSEGDFSHFLKLVAFEETNFLDKETEFFSEIIENLGIENIKIDLFENSEKLTTENIFTFIHKHEKSKKIFSKIYENEIEFISSHFYEIYDNNKNELFKLSEKSLFEIINNNKLQLNDEDQLLKFVNELYSRNSKYSFFYECVNFLNVTSDQIEEFITIFDMNDMTNMTWKNLCDRLKQNIDKKDKNENEKEIKRYKKIKENQSKDVISFPINSNNEFSGIFNYLKNKSSSNIDNEVNFTASSVNCSSDNQQPRNVVLYEDKRKSFFSNNKENSWICFEFKNYHVNPTHYTIRTANWGQSGHHPKSWVIEGSNDNKSWEILDERRECQELKGNDISHTFSINNQTSNEFKYIRMRQIGPNWYSSSNHHLIIDAFEIYGKLK